MITKPSPPAVPLIDRCLSMYAFFGFVAGVVLVCIVWMLSAVHEPPLWLSVLGAVAVLLAAARVCDAAARRHVTGRRHNPGAP